MLKRLLTADFVIALGFLAMAVVVVAHAQRWPFRSAIFPLLAGWSLLVVTVLKLGADVMAARAVAKAPVATPAHDGESEEESEEEEEDVFQTASRREWLAAFGWVALFFVALWLLGALVSIPSFTLIYLLVVSRESPVLAGSYAFVCWLFVYGLFDRGLNVPLPAGVLLRALGL